MKKVQNYIESLLLSSHYALTSRDVQAIEKNGLNDWILGRLLSKKFRKTKALDECIARTKHAIDMRLDRKEPIVVVFPQGGYKLWRFPSSPEADWAEYFAISYILEYLAPIAAAYDPGIKLIFYMHTLLMEKHDNLTTEEINRYVASFQRLIELFSEHAPNNVEIEIMRDADIYTRREYFEALESGLKTARETFESMPKDKKEKMKKMSGLNIKWDGAEPWNLLSSSEKNMQLEKSILYELSATQNLPKVTERIKSEQNVLVFTAATPQFIGIGSTKTSMAKYWVGFGVLEPYKNSYLPRILTPSQYKRILSTDYNKVNIDNLLGDNFKEVMILKKPMFK